ncbi:protein of unknown function (plasmid) [Caballeronia sp. S22]
MIRMGVYLAATGWISNGSSAFTVPLVVPTGRITKRIAVRRASNQISFCAMRVCACFTWRV